MANAIKVTRIWDMDESNTAYFMVEGRDEAATDAVLDNLPESEIAYFEWNRTNCGEETDKGFGEQVGVSYERGTLKAAEKAFRAAVKGV